MEKVNYDQCYSWVKTAFFLAAAGVMGLVGLTIIYETDLRGVESNVIYSLQLVLESNALLFASPESPPFNITQYSPLYYVIGDGVLSVVRVDAESHFTIRVITRLLSVMFLIGSLYVIYDVLREFLGFGRRISLVVVLFYFVISFPWFNLSRPDVLVLLFTTLSVRCVLLLLQDNEGIRPAVLLGVWMALGLLAKLTMGIYLVAFGMHLLLIGRWRAAFVATVSFSGTMALFLVAIHYLGYDLSFLYENVLLGIDNGINFTDAFNKTFRNYFTYFGLFSLAFLLLSVVYWKDHRKSGSDPALAFLLTVSYPVAALSFFSALKVGSSINYFNELLLFMTLFAVTFVHRYRLLRRELYLGGLMLFGVSIAINHFFRYAPLLASNVVHLVGGEEEADNSVLVVEYLRSNLQEDYFFSEDKSVALSLPNKCILFPTDIHALTYQRGVFNYEKMEDWAVENLRFILVAAGRTELYGLDINKHYTLKHGYGDYNLYELTSRLKD